MSAPTDEGRRSPVEHVVPARPLLPGFFRVIPMGPDAVQLRSTGRVYRVAGTDVASISADLLRALDGRSTVSELAARFSVDPDVVKRLVGRLHTDGLVHEGAVANGDHGAALAHTANGEFYSESGGDPTSAQRAVATSRVVFRGLGPVARMAAAHVAAAGVAEIVLIEDGPVTSFDQAILGSGWDGSRVDAAAALCAAATEPGAGGVTAVTITRASSLDEVVSRADLVVTEVDEAGLAAESANQSCLDAGVALLAHELTTARAIVGPTVQPGAPCWECVIERRLGHLRHVEELLAFRDAVREGTVPERQPGVPVGAVSIVAGLLSMEALHFLGRFRQPTTLGGVLVADLRTLEVVREEVLPVPGCPGCDSRQEELLLRP